MKDLEKVSATEQAEFLNSFDHVLSDMDGVIWLINKPIEGASACFERFKKLGKPVRFVTNNDFNTPTGIQANLANRGFVGFTADDIVNPTTAIIEYLKKIKFDREIYVVGSQLNRAAYERAGFKLAPLPPTELADESAEGILPHLEDDDNIGCVIISISTNVTFLKLQKALVYLKRKDCLWITGTLDKTCPIGPKGPLLGMHYNVKAIKEISGRDYIHIAKPSREYAEFIDEKFHFVDKTRVLFIGDTITEDMGLATQGGYKKLLVFSGTAKLNDLEVWKHSEELKPDYYIKSLGTLNSIMDNLNLNNKT